MAPTSRRHLLSVAAASVVPFAGCSGLGGTGSAGRSATAVAETGPPDGDTDLPEYGYLRHDERAPIVRFAGKDGHDDRGDREYHPRPLVLDSSDRAGRLEYRTVDGVDAVREFVTSTDFDAATVYVDQRDIQACYRLDLCSIDWTSSDIHLDYGRVPLPWDVSCEADATVIEARFVRIPDVLDHESVNSMGSSTGRGQCPNAPGPVVGGDLPGGEDATTPGGTETTGGGE